MKKSATVILLLLAVSQLYAQTQFLDKAVIEFEVKANIKKTMGNGSWDEMLKENLPTFKTGFYNLTFADNKSIYKFDHWDPNTKMPEFLRRDDETNNWFMNFDNRTLTSVKTVAGSAINVQDSLPTMSWKIMDERRVIAGFNCRKAVTVIQDSVYVFAFYTDEILIPGGPCSFNGLPGTILGITIPRLYTSWVAAKVSVNGVPVADIKPTDAKKYYTTSAMRRLLEDRTKDWFNDGEMTDENRQQKNRFIWGVML